jgi:hypothetical protein
MLRFIQKRSKTINSQRRKTGLLKSVCKSGEIFEHTFDSIGSVYISNIVSVLQISAKSSSTVLVASSAALLNSYSISSSLNVNLFLCLAAMEAIANIQYLIREVSNFVNS